MQEFPTLDEAAALSRKCHGSTLGTREAIRDIREDTDQKSLENQEGSRGCNLEQLRAVRSTGLTERAGENTDPEILQKPDEEHACPEMLMCVGHEMLHGEKCKSLSWSKQEGSKEVETQLLRLSQRGRKRGGRGHSSPRS